MRISDWSSDVCSSDLIAQDGKHVACLQCRADAASDRLGAVGEQAARLEARARGNRPHAFGEMAGALFAAHLSGWADRNVDDYMGRASRDLLGKDRGNELALGIDFPNGRVSRRETGCRYVELRESAIQWKKEEIEQIDK